MDKHVYNLIMDDDSSGQRFPTGYGGWSPVKHDMQKLRCDDADSTTETYVTNKGSGTENRHRTVSSSFGVSDLL